MAVSAIAGVPTGRAPAETDWVGLAQRARTRRRVQAFFLIAFLVVTSLPIILPYMWLVTISFTGRGGVGDTFVLWRLVAILGPVLLVGMIVSMNLSSSRQRRICYLALAALAAALLAVFVLPYVHSDNYRFLWNPNIIEDTRGASGAGGDQFPSVWTAFGNSLALAVVQMAVVVAVSTLAGYYLSRFGFRGRETFLKSLLVLHAFPAMTLVIPIFLLMYWSGLLDTITGVVLVICTLELPFAIFIMKGFFDAVPWDIEMSAMVDGASRRQAFVQVVLPQVRFGMMAVGVFAFIRGWEEYVFVRTLLFDKQNWVMSMYLFFVKDDTMGSDNGMVTAVGVFYLLPSIILYALTQKYLTQMSIGGIKG